MTHGEVRLETSVYLMDDVLNLVEKGRWRVPRFQRPFVWTPERMLDLFDSIERGYPIGSVLLWQTDEPLQTVEAIGNIPVPTGAGEGRVAYVLDGHQRLSTLFGVLRRPRGESADWRWAVYRDLRHDPADYPRTDLYVHYRRSGSPPEYYLPLRAVPRTRDFLNFARVMEETTTLDVDFVDESLRRAEAVAQTIKSYQLAVVTLVGGTLEQAVEVYTRLNRSGMRMEADQMVSALTYRESGGPSLAARIDEIISSVATTGFGELQRTAVFRAVLAIAGADDIMTPRWETLAKRLEHRLVDAIPAADRAIHTAVRFLRSIGLPLAKLLPYAHQLTLLAAFFNECPNPTAQQRELLRRWFWVTSWTDAFAGATSTTIRDGLRTMHRLAIGDGYLDLPIDDVVPKPERFNFNSARTRAYVAWELREFPERLDETGRPFDPVEALAASDTQIYRWVGAADTRPANKVIMPSPTGRHPWDQICEPITADVHAFLKSHGIPPRARDRLREGRNEAFVDAREDLLDRRLRAFMDDLQVPIYADRLGDSQDDTE